jgi:phosphoglycerol transferase MdoB-like AlkP superfamily enzyme
MTSTNKNEGSKEKSQKEHFLQIYLPITTFVLLVIIVAVLVIIISGTNIQSVQQWANVSVVLLIVPSLFISLIMLAIFILVILVQAKLLKWLPIHFANFYVFIMKIAIFIMNGSNKIVSPVINSKSKFFALKSIWKKGRI